MKPRQFLLKTPEPQVEKPPAAIRIIPYRLGYSDEPNRDSQWKSGFFPTLQRAQRAYFRVWLVTRLFYLACEGISQYLYHNQR
jgi:hypothetical protein